MSTLPVKLQVLRVHNAPTPLGHAHTHWLGCIKVVQVLLENHRNVVTNAMCTRPTSRNALINGLCL